VSTHAPPQADRPALQSGVHCPLWQVTVPPAGAAQAAPHVPQLLESALTSTQALPQRV
jgi:hypothetical protein